MSTRFLNSKFKGEVVALLIYIMSAVIILSTSPLLQNFGNIILPDYLSIRWSHNKLVF